MSNLIGRPRALDEQKKRDVIRVIELGGTCELAARFVGCHCRTIQRAVANDEKFGWAMHRAQGKSEVVHLAAIRAASAKNWRAAAWALERLNPDCFGRRKPFTVTSDEVTHIMKQFTNEFINEVSNPELRRILRLKAMRTQFGIRDDVYDSQEHEAKRDRKARRKALLELHPRRRLPYPRGAEEDVHDLRVPQRRSKKKA